ncbi:MAG: hypothetical protein RL573_1191, partial [Actinomycetota bacterium]
MVVAGGAAAPWLVPSPAEHSTVIVLACAAAVVLSATVALWVHRAPRLLVATTVLVSGVTALGAHNIAADGLSARQLNLRDGALLVSHVLLALGMLVATRRRLRADSRAVISDGLIIGLGAWIVLWVLLLQPALHGVTGLPAATLMRGATLAVLSVILFLVATLLFSDTAPT